MPKLDSVIESGQRLNIDQALWRRDHALHNGRPAPRFHCARCAMPLIAHKGSRRSDAYFAHRAAGVMCQAPDPGKQALSGAAAG